METGFNGRSPGGKRAPSVPLDRLRAGAIPAAAGENMAAAVC